MTPQEKEAKRIFDLFKLEGNYLQGREDQKKQALIFVREIMNEYSNRQMNDNRWAFWAQVEQILKEKY